MGLVQDDRGRLWRDSVFVSYISTLGRVLSWKLALVVGLMVLLGLTEGIGLLMLVPLLEVVGLDVTQRALGRIAQLLSSAFAIVGVRPTLPAVLGVYVFLVVVKGLVHHSQTVVNDSLLHGLVASLRRQLYQAIANTTWLFFSRCRSSEFTHILTNEVERIGAATYYLVSLVATGLVALAYLGFALKLSAVMTGVVLACGGALTLVLNRKTEAARQAGIGLSEAMSGLYSAITEHLGGMKIIKSHNTEDRHVDIFARVTERVRRAGTRATRNYADVTYWFELGSVLLLSLVVLVSIDLLAISTAEVLLLLFLFARLMPQLSGMQQSYQNFLNELPAFASVLDMGTRCRAAAEPSDRGTERVDFQRSIRFEHVSFSYDEMPVIRDLTLTIRAGETTAIVGPSGAGKSTVADLAIGLVVPARGRVLVDEIPLSRERIRAWREQIGYVAQDTFLFHDTVRANLVWARPDATEDEVHRALRLAAAEEFVLKLPQGLGTLVGDRGVRLSGGERQRLALARALLRKPSLLILDEATNALDTENEERILGAIQGLRGSTTILLITHRLSAVRWADIIHVLEGGGLVESGDWYTLVAKANGRFLGLWDAQDMGSDENGAEPERGDASSRQLLPAGMKKLAGPPGLGSSPDPNVR